MSALTADVWADLVAWAVTTAPIFVLHHLLLKRHIRNVAADQTTALQGSTPDERTAFRQEPRPAGPPADR